LPAPFDKTRLIEQKDTAYRLLYGAERMGKPTASFWHIVSNSVELKCSLSEWLSLANIALVQVFGSVEKSGSSASLPSSRKRGGTACFQIT